MKAKEFIYGNMQRTSERELQFNTSSVNDITRPSETPDADPDIPVPPKK